MDTEIECSSNVCVTDDAVGFPRGAEDSSQTQIANLDLSKMTIDKDVVTFEVSMYNRGVKGMQINKSLQYLCSPAFDGSHVYLLVYLSVSAASRKRRQKMVRKHKK